MSIRLSREVIFSAVTLSVCFFLLRTPFAEAALLYIDPGEATLHRGDSVTLNLRIVSDPGECINAIDAVIHYDPSISAVDISRGSSIVSLWVEDPKINEADHTITLAGGIPGGYCGRVSGDPSLSNSVVSLIFRLPGFVVSADSASTTATVRVDPQSQVLLNDGFGTVAPLMTQDAIITLLQTPGNTTNEAWRTQVASDKIPPADFSITLSRDTAAFSGKYFISFSTSDKQSGIDHYEVMEEPITDLYAFKWGRADAPWITTQSPYVLKDQSLNSTIRVRVIDKAGNERISVLVPDNALRTLSPNRLMTIVIGAGTALVLLIALVYFLVRRRRALITRTETEKYAE